MAHKPHTIAAFVTIMLALLVSVVLVAGCGEGGLVPLKYQYKAGDSFTYDLKMLINGKVTGAGVSADEGVIPKNTTMTMRLSIKVKSVDNDGVATVGYTLQDMKMAAEGQPPETVPLVQTPKEVTFKIDRQGRVLSVEGLGQIPGMSGQSGLPFDPSQFSAQTNVILPPNGTGEPGQEWTVNAKVPMPLTDQQINATTKGKLVSIGEEAGRKVANIEYTVNAPLDIVLDIGEMMKKMGLDQMIPGASGELNFKMSLKGKEDMKGTAKFDTEKGVPLAFTGDIGLDITMEILEAPAELVPQEERTPISMDMTIKLEMNEVK